MRLLLSTCAILIALGIPSAQAADPLGQYPVDPGQISVAGISSGAFMANQFHIAHSADVMGAAMVAGGLYGCAVEAVDNDGVRALVMQAIWDCTLLPDNIKDVSAYADEAREIEAKGWIDPLSNLARSKVYFFSGRSDGVVPEKTVETGLALYEALGVPRDNIASVDRSGPAANAGHSWVTNNCCEACDLTQSPYIDNCGYDQALAELRAIYGPDLKPAAPSATGRIVAFDQKEFVPAGATAANGLFDTGYLYVPTACEPGAASPCRLQVVLHGCEQSAEKLGDVFYTKIGVNEAAEANNIIVLYPQAHAMIFSNPKGCWNWWGYADDSQFLTKKGVQIDAIWKMIQRLEGK
jgi:poly(3-hydroxybutyrate) depolymerase